VILWARDEQAMQVLDPEATRPRRFSRALPERLREGLAAARA